VLILDAPEIFIEKLSLVFEKFRKYSFFEVTCSVGFTSKKSSNFKPSDDRQLFRILFSVVPVTTDCSHVENLDLSTPNQSSVL
jgi:hypothetical protein